MYVWCIYCTEEEELDALLEAELEAEFKEEAELKKLNTKIKNKSKGAKQYTRTEQLQYQCGKVEEELSSLERCAENGDIDENSAEYKCLLE